MKTLSIAFAAMTLITLVILAYPDSTSDVERMQSATNTLHNSLQGLLAAKKGLH